jgi:Predicted ester cyclase
MRTHFKINKTLLFNLNLLMLLFVTSCSSPKTDTTVDDNIKMYAHTWDAVINEGKINLLDSAFSPDIVLHTSPTEIRGIDSAKKYYANYVTGFSNRQFIVKEIFGQGDKLVKYWLFKGTHSGDFFGIKATGKTVNVEGATIARIVNGKIMEERDFFDNLEFSQQLGLIPR